MVPFAEPVGFPGASGGAAGVNAADDEEKLPVLCEFIAATLNIYVVPFVKPPMVTTVEVETSRAKVVQVAPESLEY